MKKFPWKQLFEIAAIMALVFIGWEIYKVFAAGVSDIASILKAPFTAVSKVWSSITSFFTGFSSSAPGTVAGTGQTPAQLTGVDANTPLGQLVNSQPNVDAINAALLGVPADNSSSLPVVGIWDTTP